MIGITMALSSHYEMMADMKRACADLANYAAAHNLRLAAHTLAKIHRRAYHTRRKNDNAWRRCWRLLVRGLSGLTANAEADVSAMVVPKLAGFSSAERVAIRLHLGYVAASANPDAL
jgi:hypothetical protein